MFNLLPESLKSTIRSDYKQRVVVVGLLVVIFIQISFLLFLVPSWLISMYKEKDALVATEAMNQSKMVSSINSISTVIADTNTKLNIISKALEYKKVLPILNTIINNKTSSIRLNDFSYTYLSSNSASVVISGVSATRDSLVAFVNALQKTTQFKNVDLPVSNLTKDKNINFSLTLSVSP